MSCGLRLVLGREKGRGAEIPQINQLSKDAQNHEYRLYIRLLIIIVK